ncbi:hypothetical protein BC829DRAFT_401632 [Chytridium lagenaria]|nr:hypothetical protein BC829DRAFT_401632 [Chytridium lagenaria]
MRSLMPRNRAQPSLPISKNSRKIIFVNEGEVTAVPPPSEAERNVWDYIENWKPSKPLSKARNLQKKQIMSLTQFQRCDGGVWVAPKNMVYGRTMADVVQQGSQPNNTSTSSAPRPLADPVIKRPTLTTPTQGAKRNNDTPSNCSPSKREEQWSTVTTKKKDELKGSQKPKFKRIASTILKITPPPLPSYVDQSLESRVPSSVPASASPPIPASAVMTPPTETTSQQLPSSSASTMTRPAPTTPTFYPPSNAWPQLRSPTPRSTKPLANPAKKSMTIRIGALSSKADTTLKIERHGVTNSAMQTSVQTAEAIEQTTTSSLSCLRTESVINVTPMTQNSKWRRAQRRANKLETALTNPPETFIESPKVSQHPVIAITKTNSAHMDSESLLKHVSTPAIRNDNDDEVDGRNLLKEARSNNVRDETIEKKEEEKVYMVASAFEAPEAVKKIVMNSDEIKTEDTEDVKPDSSEDEVNGLEVAEIVETFKQKERREHLERVEAKNKRKADRREMREEQLRLRGYVAKEWWKLGATDFTPSVF